MGGVSPGRDTTGLRTLVVWCPDWPVVASGLSADAMVAVVEANRVVACSAPARAEGVKRGLRRREAQARCPGLEIITADPSRDARTFEPVVVAVEAFTPGIEIIRPGVVAIATRGPSRYFGGDLALAAKVASAVDAKIAAGAPRCRIGVADGRFAAEQAARQAGVGAPLRATPTAMGGMHMGPEAGTKAAGTKAAGTKAAGTKGARKGETKGARKGETKRDAVLVVPPGASAAFVAPLGISSLPFDDLSARLDRLGVRTLGDLAALPASSVLARFGPEGAEAHRLARGLDDRPLAARTPPPDLAVSAELDPPAERVDTAAFVAKALADQLHASLAKAGLACTRVAIEAETEHGEQLVRLWRHDGALSAGAIAERVRWQLDGWLSRGGVTGGLTRLRLAPDEVRPDLGRQLGFWGASTDDDGIARTLARLQGILGPDGVVTAVLGGGRDPVEQIRLVPWGDPRTPALSGPPLADGRSAAQSGPPLREGRSGRRRGPPPEVPTWPGRLPGPAPAVVHSPPLAAQVRDGRGGAVTVSGRGALSEAPAEVSMGGGPWCRIEAWAGPWPVEERWWEGGRRRARFQVVTAGGAAHLLAREAESWWIEATYD